MNKITKDKLILVFKINVNNIDPIDAYAYIDEIAAHFTPKEDEDAVAYFVPIRHDTEHPVECINPKLLTDDEFEHVTERLNNIEKAYKEFMEELKIN